MSDLHRNALLDDGPRCFRCQAPTEGEDHCETCEAKLHTADMAAVLKPFAEIAAIFDRAGKQP